MVDETLPKEMPKYQQQPKIRLANFPLGESVKSLKVFQKLKSAELALRMAQKTGQRINSSVAKHIQNMCENARELAIKLLQKDEANSDYISLYSTSCVLVASSHLLEVNSIDRKDYNRVTNAALRALDLAMLRGGMEVWSEICRPFLDFASRSRFDSIPLIAATSIIGVDERPKSVPKPPQYITEQEYAREIPRVDSRSLSVEEFSSQFMERAQPVILTHVVDSWPATRMWKNMDYLKAKAAGRLVPIETTSKDDAGRSFMSDSWKHQFICFDEYISKYVKQKPDDVVIEDHAYLAQHPLFEQVPDLREDIAVPSYCSGRTSRDENAPSDASFATEPLVSAWFGGKGTVSPIHNDPYENTLAQIVGTKYVRIYEAHYSNRLYPILNHLGHNSQVDIDAPDFEKFPLFEDTPCWQTILRAGELLYIPRNSWHYVRSLEISFSASFWYGAKMELVVQENGIDVKYLT